MPSINYDLSPEHLEFVRENYDSTGTFLAVPRVAKACYYTRLVTHAVETCVKGDPEKYATIVPNRMVFGEAYVRKGIDVGRMLKPFNLDDEHDAIPAVAFVFDLLKPHQRAKWSGVLDKAGPDTEAGSAKRFACMLMRNKGTRAGASLPVWVTSALTPPQPSADIVEEEKVASAPSPPPVESIPAPPVVEKPVEVKNQEPVVLMEDDPVLAAPAPRTPAPTPAKVVEEACGGKNGLTDDLVGLVTKMAEKLNQLGDLALDKNVIHEEETKRHEADMRSLKEDQAKAMADARKDFDSKLADALKEKARLVVENAAVKLKYDTIQSEFKDFKEDVEGEQKAGEEMMTILSSQITALKRELEDKADGPATKRRKTE